MALQYGIDVNGKSIVTGGTPDQTQSAPNGRIDKLEEERRRALDRLESLRTYYERPEAAQLLQQLQSRASGGDSPFNADVTNSMYGANADAGAGNVRRDDDMIRRSFANSGMSGSGLEASAMVMSRRRAAAQSRAGRNEITSRAALENYQARERAQAQVASYMQQRQQAEAMAGLAEVDFRSKMQEVTDTPEGGTYQAPQQAQQAAPAPAGDQYYKDRFGRTLKLGVPGSSGGYSDANGGNTGNVNWMTKTFDQLNPSAMNTGIANNGGNPNGAYNGSPLMSSWFGQPGQASSNPYNAPQQQQQFAPVQQQAQQQAPQQYNPAADKALASFNRPSAGQAYQDYARSQSPTSSTSMLRTLLGNSFSNPGLLPDPEYYGGGNLNNLLAFGGK